MRKYAPLVLFISYLLVLTVFSLFSFGKVSSLGSEWDDKLHHFLAHALLTYLAYNAYRRIKPVRPEVLALLTSVIYGIIIEVLQLTLTDDRVFDLMDLFANFLGAISAFILLNYRRFLKLK